MPTIDLAILSGFALLWAVIVPTPGPNSLMITHTALTQDWRRVAAALAGNSLGSTTLALAALAGMAALLAAFPWLRLVIHVIGGLYLVWVGIRLVRRSLAGSASATLAGAVGSDPQTSLGRAFAVGLATALSNAQAVIFITSIFAATGVLAASLPTGLAVVATLVTMNAAYLGGLAWLLQRPLARRTYLRLRRPFEGLVGVVFLGFGIRMVVKELR